MAGNVRGVLFRDYVRMIRGAKHIDWKAALEPEDYAYVTSRISVDDWYPMASFERIGNVIFRRLADNDLVAVRMWGRASVGDLCATQPDLVAPRDPIETLMRMRVLRATFFDFPALAIPELLDDQAEITISYRMGPLAEEAASHQTMGVFERLLELATARDVVAELTAKSWAGDPTTVLELRWSLRRSSIS
jgi:hypothetical protein